MSVKKNRREFLKIAGAAAFGVAVSSANTFAQRSRKRCVIVGAGLSGLAAAYKLKKANWNVTILDARERIGGRVFSHRLPENKNLICELGAEWVGASHERIQALCREFQIPLQDHRFQASLLRDGKFSRPSEWSFSAQAKEAFAKFLKNYEKLTAAQRTNLDRMDWWTYLEKIGFTDDDLRLRDLMDSTDFGESIRHVSAYAAAAEYAESSPENEMDFKMTGGNSRLVEELAKRIGVDAFRLNTKVNAIEQRAGNVTVRAGNQTFIADACICTVPATVLNEIKFSPPLPATQAAAADRLQYARICKNSVLYGERFWGDENFSLVSDLTSHYYFHSTQNQPGTEGILTSYAVGEKADVLSSQSDKRRMEIIARDLTVINQNTPNLARGIASYAWQRDRFTQGAYALYRPGQWFGIRPILRRPHGKVLFAGEHIADWQGFMEGAIETGESAAQTLVKN